RLCVAMRTVQSVFSMPTQSRGTAPPAPLPIGGNGKGVPASRRTARIELGSLAANSITIVFMAPLANACAIAPGSRNSLRGWIATNQVPRPQGIALKQVEDALQGCSQGVAMQCIEPVMEPKYAFP